MRERDLVAKPLSLILSFTLISLPAIESPLNRYVLCLVAGAGVILSTIVMSGHFGRRLALGCGTFIGGSLIGYFQGAYIWFPVIPVIVFIVAEAIHKHLGAAVCFVLIYFSVSTVMECYVLWVELSSNFYGFAINLSAIALCFSWVYSVQCGRST